MLCTEQATLHYWLGFFHYIKNNRWSYLRAVVFSYFMVFIGMYLLHNNNITPSYPYTHYKMPYENIV